MPTQTVSFDREQYEYILSTTDGSSNVSERVRELVDKGIKVETDE